MRLLSSFSQKAFPATPTWGRHLSWSCVTGLFQTFFFFLNPDSVFGVSHALGFVVSWWVGPNGEVVVPLN